MCWGALSRPQCHEKVRNVQRFFWCPRGRVTDNSRHTTLTNDVSKSEKAADAHPISESTASVWDCTLASHLWRLVYNPTCRPFEFCVCRVGTVSGRQPAQRYLSAPPATGAAVVSATPSSTRR